jgi:hypothetical protein
MRERMLFRTNEGFALLLLGIVIAILAGLLAMHTLTSTMGNHNGDRSGTLAMAVVTDHSTGAATATLQETVVAVCSGPCDPGNGMTTLQCILALIAATLATVAACASNRMELIARPAQRYKSLPEANSRGIGRPPDLTDLSISRT